MTSLGILAHHDARGLVAPHVLRHAEALAQVCDRVLVVSAGGLTEQAQAEVRARAELLLRDNAGYDFASWHAGLLHVGGWAQLHRVLLVNDSVVGPLVPYEQIVAAAVEAGAGWWGITSSDERVHHVQSYVVGLEAAVLGHPVLAAFWDGLGVPEDREQAIERGELRLSAALTEAGFAPWTYFTPTADDQRVALGRRVRQVYLHNTAAAGSAPDPEQVRRQAWRDAERMRRQGVAYNPMNALWDRALDGRLPFVKLETLRDDPYHLDPHGRMLDELEAAHPDAFAGVRALLEATREAYGGGGRSRDEGTALRVAAPKAAHLTGPWGMVDPATDDEERSTTDVEPTALTADDYGDSYYAAHLGPAYDPAEPHWQRFFGRVAGRIVDTLHPRTFLDVGCAMGILVGNLRELGVDAEGVDHSAYAISKADPRAEGHLRVADLLEERLEGRWDAISAIEVLEHLPSGQVDEVIANLCEVTDTIVFSSTPDDFDEGTHINVRPPGYWAALFADHGFYRRFDIDASFLSRAAIVYQRRDVATRGLVSDYENALWFTQRDALGTRDAVIRRDRELAELKATLAAQAKELAEAKAEAARLAKRITVIESSTGYRAANGVTRRLGRLKGSGSKD